MIDACVLNENGGYFVKSCVITSRFQADSFIAYCLMSNLSDFIYGEDSDYFVLLGSNCLLMWNMKAVATNKQCGRKRKQKNDDGKEIVCDTKLKYMVPAI